MPTSTIRIRYTTHALVILVIVAFVAYYTALLIDHLIMVNGSVYPRAFSTPVSLPSLDGEDGLDALTDLCNGEGGWVFYEKHNGYFMRCTTILSGSSSWPKTFVITNYDQQPAKPATP